MGFGDRFKGPRYVTKDVKPGPSQYDIPSLFNPNQTMGSFSNYSSFQKGTKTHCFGAGRDDFRKTVVNFDKQYGDPGNPGPGRHDVSKFLSSTSPSFSVSFKIDFDHDTKLAKRRNIPAPGAYEDDCSINNRGKYSLSTHKNSQAIKWSKAEKIPMDVREAAKYPGPGVHENTGNIASSYQPVSSFKTV